MNLKQLKGRLLKDPKFKKEYYNNDDLYFEISEMVKNARIQKGLTQVQLAQIVNTKQPSIARIESGSYIPTISFLNKIADALNMQFIPPKFYIPIVVDEIMHENFIDQSNISLRQENSFNVSSSNDTRRLLQTNDVHILTDKRSTCDSSFISTMPEVLPA